METTETIRTCMQTGEWITPIDFKDAYFPIPINPQSRKYQHFYIQGRSYQVKALPFGMFTAQIDFTAVVKEVKLMAPNKGVRIPQYQNNWLVRDTSHTSPSYTDTELGLMLNLDKLDQIYSGTLADLKLENSEASHQPLVLGQTAHVSNRVFVSNRKASPPGLDPHEAHSMAPEKSLEDPMISRKGDPKPKISPHT